MHLPHRHRKFLTRLLTGATAKAAYLHAFPNVKPHSARAAGSRLLRRPHIQAELTTLRQKAESVPSSEFLAYVEKRKFYARVVRARVALLPDSSDLWTVQQSAKGNIYLRFPDKLRALMDDAKLAGYDRPPQAPDPAHDSLTALLERLRQEPNNPPQTPAPGTPLVGEVTASSTGDAAFKHPGSPRPPAPPPQW